jgi:hypothetical protein
VESQIRVVVTFVDSRFEVGNKEIPLKMNTDAGTQTAPLFVAEQWAM